MHYQIANLQVKTGYHGGKGDTMPLLLDEDGYVTESTGANFIMIKDGKLISPELRNMLRGSSMEYVLNVLAPQINIPVEYKNFEYYDLLNCDEAIFTGTYVNLLPCNRIDSIYFNEDLKSNPIGPITNKIIEAWSENVGVDFIKQIKNWSKKYLREDDQRDFN
jgi:branched-chain amino acid aminotransferase